MDKAQELEKLKFKWERAHDVKLPSEAVEAIEEGKDYTSAFYIGEKSIGIKKGFVGRFKEGFQESQAAQKEQKKQVDKDNENVSTQNSDVQTNSSITDEEMIREKVRIEDDEKEKIQKEKDDEEGKGCLGFVLIMFVISGIGYLIKHFF